jgi:hypothetical protein
MKRTISLGSLLLFIAPFACASTQVPDTLSGNVDWDSTQSPYIIQGKVEVPQGSVLHIGPGVRVVYQGVGELSVQGLLEISGSAAAPVVFDMTQAGLQSQFVLTGAQGDISDAKFLGGVFLIRDSQVSIQESEFTKGSGIYLQGKTEAVLKSNKIYGNATGAVLDGPALKATFLFNTFVQNTYGLYLKNYLYLKFSNNSVHDNNEQVINATHGTAQLGGNYWGSTDSGAVHLKTQGAADFSPLKDLKDVLRVYIMTQLPDITQVQSDAMAKKERKQEKADALAMKKWNKQQEMEAKAAAAAAQKATASPATGTAPAPPPLTVIPEQAATAPEASEASPSETAPETTTVEEVPAGPSGVAVVKSLPPAPHSLPPLTNLPPEQDLNLGGAASSAAVVEEAPAAAPAETAPPEAAAPPPLPDMSVPPVTGTTSANQTVPPPPAAPLSDDNSIPPPPPGLDSSDSSSVGTQPAANASAPPAANPTDLDAMPPPMPANPANGMEEVPPVPPSGTSPSTPAVPQAVPTAAVTTGRVSANGGASDDLQAPSADLSAVAPSQGTSQAVSTSTGSASAPITSTTDLALPPIHQKIIQNPDWGFAG